MQIVAFIFDTTHGSDIDLGLQLLPIHLSNVYRYMYRPGDSY